MYTSVPVIVFCLFQERSVFLHNLLLFLLYLDLVIFTGGFFCFVLFAFLIHLGESDTHSLILKYLYNSTCRHAFKKLQSRPVMLVPIFMRLQYLLEVWVFVTHTSQKVLDTKIIM